MTLGMQKLEQIKHAKFWHRLTLPQCDSGTHQLQSLLLQLLLQLLQQLHWQVLTPRMQRQGRLMPCGLQMRHLHQIPNLFEQYDKGECLLLNG